MEHFHSDWTFKPITMLHVNTPTVAGQLWAMLPSTGNQVRQRAHDRSKVIQIEICYPFSMGKCPNDIAQRSCSAKLLKNLPHVSSVLHLNPPLNLPIPPNLSLTLPVSHLNSSRSKLYLCFEVHSS